MDANYIRGFFDGEGCAGLYTHGAKRHGRALKPRILLANTCLPLLNEIKTFLEILDYKVVIKTPANKSNPCHQLELCRWEDVLRFIDEIGSNHPDKLVRFKEIVRHKQTIRRGRPKRA